MRSFGEPRAGNHENSGDAPRSGARIVPRHRAPCGERPRNVAGGKRLLGFFFRAARCARVVTVVEENMRPGSPEAAFHDALPRVGTRHCREHRDARASKAGVPGSQTEQSTRGAGCVKWRLIPKLAHFRGGSHRRLVALAREPNPERDVSLLERIHSRVKSSPLSECKVERSCALYAPGTIGSPPGFESSRVSTAAASCISPAATKSAPGNPPIEK